MGAEEAWFRLNVYISDYKIKANLGYEASTCPNCNLVNQEPAESHED